MTLSIVIITLNEQALIAECIRSASFADEVIVLDGGSCDATAETARQNGATVYHHSFDDFASQKNRAIAKAKGDWIFVLDADERIPDELREEIQKIVVENPEGAFKVGRATYFFKRLLRFSGTQNDFPVRLWPAGCARFEQPVHEKIVTSLPVKRLKHKLIHLGTRDLNHYLKKVDCYIRYEIQILKNRSKQPVLADLILRPPARFFYLYFRQAGLLDGWTGFQFAALSAYYEWIRQKTFLKKKSV